MKRLMRFTYIAGLSLVASLILGTHHASASNPADLSVGLGYQDLSGKLHPIKDLDVTVKVVPRTPSNGPDIPIANSPYNGHNLSPGGGNPTTNSIVFKTNEGTAGDVFKRGDFGYRSYSQLVWCGDSQGIPLGEFKLNVSVAGSSTEISYGGSTKKGHWIGYWHFQSGGRSDKDYGFDGKAVEIYAKNGVESFIYFEFVESNTASTSVNGYKVERKPDGSLPPAGEFTDAGVHLGAAVSTSNPYFFYNVDPTKTNRMVADDTDDWTQDGYTGLYRALDGSVGGTTSGDRVYDIPVMYPGTTVETRWLYAPRPSTVSTAVYIRNPKDGTMINPCSSDKAYVQALCRAGTVSISRTGPGGALKDHLNADGTRTNYATSASGAPTGAANSLVKGDLYYGDYKTSMTKVPDGFKPYGTIVCDINAADDGCAASKPVTATSDLTAAISVEPNRSYRTFMVLDPDIGFSSTASVTCDTLKGTLKVPDGVKVDIILNQKDQDIVVASGLQSGAVNATIPAPARDGLSRTVYLIVRNDAGQEVFRIATPYSHQCANAATCGATSLAAAFPDELGDADTSIDVKMTMNNTGDSQWRNGVLPDGYTTGEHALILTGKSTDYWVVDDQGKPSGGSLGDKEVITNGNAKEFTVSLKPKANAVLVNVPITWRMAFIAQDGTVTPFGETCNTSGNPITPTLRYAYHPWLRVQNGSVAALGKIEGQTLGSRGTRKVDDPVKDATYLVMSVVGGSDFCSSNAYVFGQDTSDECAQSFGAYAMALDQSQSKQYFSKIQAFIDSNPSCIDAGAASAARRTSVVAPADITSQMKPTGDYTVSDPKGGYCDVILQANGGTLKQPTGGGNWTIKKGKVSLVHEGNLTINANIVSSPGGGANDLASLTQQFPAFGIIVNGDVTISSAVTELDAMIFATGKIKTCDVYPASTGTTDKDAAQKCSEKLVVRGGLYAIGGFELGRNHFEYQQARGISDPNFDYQSADKYYGGPAEEIIGNGVNLITTPPGFDLLPDGNSGSLFYLQGNFTPKF